MFGNRPTEEVTRFWVCPSEVFVRWETASGEQYLAYLWDGCASGPDAEACPEWLVDEAIAALSDSGTRHPAFAGMDRDWSAADDAMCEAFERRAA